MLNNDFCDFLERQLSKAFANSSIDSIKNFWCDGILPPTFENQYSKKFVNDNRKVVMTAFVGVSGQDKYELTLNFGSKSLSKYQRDLELFECVPNPEKANWFDINIEQKKITILLD